MPKDKREAIDDLPPDQQVEARALLDAYKSALKANPLLGYKPHPKQEIFHQSQEPLKAFLGGNQSGKTTAGLLDDIIQAVDEDAVPEHLKPYKKFQPPFLCRIVCPDFTRNMEGVIFHKLREWVPKSQLVGGEFGKAYDKQQRVLRFKNGSEMDFLSFEQDLDKFGGATKNRVHYDEEPPEEIRTEGLMRLMALNGDELFTMTPTKGMTWMYDAIWVPWTKRKLSEGFIVTVDMDDNPYLHPEAKHRALVGLSKEERAARKEGRFVHFAGVIYEAFDRHKHVIPAIEPGAIPRDASVYVGIDPGHRHMAAVLWAYLTPENEMVVFDELALQGYNIPQTCEAIKLINVKHAKQIAGTTVPLSPSWYVIDPAAKNIMHNTGRSDQMDYTTNGIITIPGQNAVPTGIDRVRWRWQNDLLFITANCTHLLDEIPKYRWKSETRTEDAPKEAPIKRDDHLLDALRYIVMSEPYASKSAQEEEFLTPLERAMQEELEGKRKKQIPKTEFGGVFA